MQNNGAVGSIVSPGLPGQGQPNTPDLHFCDQEVDVHQHQTQRRRGVCFQKKQTDGSSFFTGRDALAVMNGASVMMINPDSLSVGGWGWGVATGAVISFV